MRNKICILIVIGSCCGLHLMQGCGLNPDASESWKTDLVRQNRHGENSSGEPGALDPKKANTLPSNASPGAAVLPLDVDVTQEQVVPNEFSGKQGEISQSE